MRTRVGVAVAALAVVAAVVTGTTPAGAASVAAVGWWTSRPGATAPDGGVLVGSGLQGPTAVAAIRLDLGDGVTRARLELTEAGGVAEGTAALAVCVTGDGWEAAAGGSIEDAPATTCTGAAVAPVRADGTWTADVQALVDGRRGTVSLAVVPASGQGLWELQFDAPVLTATEVRAPASSTASTTSTTSAAGATGGSTGAAQGAAPQVGATTFAPAAPPGVAPSATLEDGTAGTATTAAPAVASDADPGADGQALGFQPLQAGSGGSASGPTAAKVLMFAAIAGAVGTVAGLGRKYATGA